MPSEGLKLTIDVSDLNDKLKQSLKNIGATYDNFGRLTDQNKKFIGTLSMTQIRMGDYIDAQGKMRNAHNFCIDGLTRNQQALRMFRDELGNVYSAEGNLIEISKQRIAALDDIGKKAIEAERESLVAKRDEYAADEEGTKAYLEFVEDRIKGIEKEAAKREQAIKSNEAFGKSLSAIGGLAGNVAQVAAIFGQADGAAGRAAQSIAKGAQALQAFTSISQAVKGVQQAMAAVTAATEAQTVAQTALNLVSGNWIALAGAGIAAVATAIGVFSSKTEETTNTVQEQTNATDALTYALKKYGTTIREVGAMRAGFMTETLSDLDRVRAAQQRVEEGNAGIRKFWETHDNAGGKNRDAYQAALDKRNDAERELADTIASVWAKDADNDPLEELRQRAQIYSEALDSGTLQGKELENAEKALANNLRKQADETAKRAREDAKAKGYGDFLKKEEAKIVQPQTQEELDAAIKKAAGDLGEGSEAYKTVVENMRAGFEKDQKEREKADAEKRLADAEKRLADAEKALGDKFQAYADGSALWTAQEKAANDLQTTIDAGTQNFKDAGRSEQELNTAIANLKQEYKDKQLQEFLNANDLKIKETEKLDAEAQYTETLKKIKEAEETYGLQAAEAEKLRAQATEELADARMKKAEEEKQERESRLNELGITGLREQMKSPFEKMMEQQAKVQQAQAEGLISAAESNQMQAKLAADYWQQNAQQTESGEPETKFEREEYKAASNLTAGSNDLYQAMTQRESSTERYQTGVTKNLDNMNRYTEENNAALTAIQSQLADVMKAVGVV